MATTNNDGGINGRIVAIIFVVIFCLTIPIGYEFNLSNAAYSSISNHSTSDLDRALVIGAFPLGAIVGSLLSPFVDAYFARKFSLFVLPNLIMIGGGLTTAWGAQSIWTLIVGRFVAAIGGGLILTVLPIFATNMWDDGEKRGNGCGESTSTSIIVGGWMNAAFWLGASLASGLGLDTVLGGAPRLWPYLALIAPFMSSMALILSPLFPRSSLSWSGSFHVRRSLESEEEFEGERRSLGVVLIESYPPVWSWRATDCRRLALGSILIGLAWSSFAPLPLFVASRSILTRQLAYSDRTAGAIEACVAVIYSCGALLSFNLIFLHRYRSVYLKVACAISTASLTLTLAFVVLATQFGAIDERTSKMGVLFSFLLCAMSYHCVLAPHFFVAHTSSSMMLCPNPKRRLWTTALTNSSMWLGFLIWTAAVPRLARLIDGWVLALYVILGVVAPVIAWDYWRRDAKRTIPIGAAANGSGSRSFLDKSWSESSRSFYGTFGAGGEKDS